MDKYGTVIKFYFNLRFLCFLCSNLIYSVVSPYLYPFQLDIGLPFVMSGHGTITEYSPLPLSYHERCLSESPIFQMRQSQLIGGAFMGNSFPPHPA